ncbi:MAG: hypothetical protein E6Q88_03110 [Lysobacteraceae bacterium]|nr:MAG: hypothetical protein E6Q88_03110 [Xanthomonadaceae bacterium]
MPNSRCLSAPVVAVACIALAACATFEIEDRYMPIEGASDFHQRRDARLYSVWIDSDTRLYSIGMFGAPMVPTRVRPGDPTTVSLSVWLDARQVRQFSFAPAPCVSGDDGPALCPDEVEIAALTRAAPPPNETDGERRFREMRPKTRIANLVIALASGAPPPRIDRARIYQHFQLDEATQWEYFSVELRYRYRCPGVCPIRLGLEQTDLIEIDGQSAVSGRVVFERRRIRDYQPMAEVQ